MDGSWKRRIPRSYIEDVACYYVWNKFEDLGVDIVICTKSGQLLEFSNKRICGVCEIQTPRAESINYFLSYDPLARYYVIKAGSVLHIVAKMDQLKVVHKYENVKHYSIKDFTNCGAPQVGIWLNGNDRSSPDILTDFTKGAVNNAATSNDAFSQIYNERLQIRPVH
ncbi:uncharacterized protein [Anabrus simplex]|uniref:uncharacterized protein n=1 Tax=Anabrus simplex TaxID=316456 RepID=UPI0035A32A70